MSCATLNTKASACGCCVAQRSSPQYVCVLEAVCVFKHVCVSVLLPLSTHMSSVPKLINAVVLLILLTALSDPEQYHLTSAELANDLDVMDDANMCIASAISLLMILICGMATYGAYKLRAAWIVPFFCYQIFDFALNTLVAVSVVVYPHTVQDYLQQLPDNFPYKEEIAALSNLCLVLIVLLFIGSILGFKAYLMACVWNCYRYVSGRGASEILLYVTTNDTAVRPR
ncbi:lysosomal-associated transmembrane protein 4B-like isoform X2 [Clinocottus analis]|uniref:lysosomal-associated transmembrane protein 4B-like isoform X2 n=1 Tax=Clinocottus analis TaxID=304258 RepID=UPI0035BF76F9